MFGIHVDRIAFAYDLDVEGEIATIIPGEPEKEKRKTKKKIQREGITTAMSPDRHQGKSNTLTS